MLVSRLRCQSENYEMDLLLDIASEVYPLRKEDRFHCVLTPTLLLSGASAGAASSAVGSASSAGLAEEGFYDPEALAPGAGSLADKFDYVMYGKIYKAEEATASKVAIYISFGGLLMKLEGDPRHWHGLQVGASIYILIKRL